MKFFAVFAAVLALSAAAPTTQWTLNDLSNAIQSPATPASYLPYLEHALNTMMEGLFSGNPIESIAVVTPIGALPVEAVVAPSPAAVMPGGVIDAAPAPVAPTTQWTLDELSNAIQNPATPASYLPYLEQALNTMMEGLFSGNPIESIAVITPIGALPVEAVVAPSPAGVMPGGVLDFDPISPVAPAPVVEPTPAVVTTDASGSPLVQIIININQDAAVAEVPAPSPVEVVDESQVLEPVFVVDEAQVPEPVLVVDEAQVPEPVLVIPEPVVIAPAPAPIVIAPENPIDVVAVSAPEVNPIDLLQPVPVAIAAGATQEGILV